MNGTTTESIGERNVLSWFPRLSREERHELYERIRQGAVGGPDFFIMMFLAAMLASLGLLQGSTAVVIGAMLVAPLMGPLVGAGLALVQGNLPLLRRAFRVALKGTLLGLVVSLLFGLASNGYEPTLEIEARGRPDLFDLFIALASGMVAAYAQGRSNVSNTLAGVAIAAALLPPLAVVGIALTIGEVDIAANAAVLLITNLVAIVIGAALVFRLLGVRARGGADSTMPAWARRTFAGLIMVSIILAAPLVLKGMDKNRAGQVRPLNYPVSAAVRDAVKEFVASKENLRLLTMGREAVEPGAKIAVMLTATGPITEDFRSELRQLIREVRTDSPLGLLDGSDPWVRIFILEEARILGRD